MQRGANSKGGGANLLFWAFLPQKTHEIQKKLGSGVLPMGSIVNFGIS